MSNLKKLLAVIMTVAMLASIMVPALAADYDDDAQKLYDLGLFKGESGSSYVPNLEGTLIRETGLALMIRAMGLEDEVLAMSDAEVNEQLAKVVDAGDIADWARPYVAYAVKNGLTKGIDASVAPNIKFGAKLDLSGREFIGFMLYAMGYTNVGWDDFLDKAAEIGMLSASEAVKFGTMNPINRDNAVGILAKSMRGITASGITLAQALVEAGVVSEEDMVEAGYMEPIVTPTPEPVELAVESAYALNLKQIAIVYNKPVDEDTAEDSKNYSLDGEYVLQDDGVTVIGTLEKSVANQSTKDLEIEDVEDTDGYVIADTKVSIEFLDMTIPEALEATVVGKDTIKVTFSEPINIDESDLTNSQLRKGFTLKDSAGKTVYVNTVTFDTNNTVARVKFYSSFKEGSYTLTVNNEYKDYAGYTVVKKDFTLDVVPDKDAPEVIGYEDAKPYEVTLIFNEDIAIVSNEEKDFYHTNYKNAVVGFGKDKLEVKDGNKLHFVFDEDTEMPPGTVYIYIAKEAIKDLWDNKNPQQIMVPVEVAGDTEPPVVEKVEASAQNELKVTFNEKLQKASAEDRGNYKLLDSEGDEVKSIIRKATLDDKAVKLSLRETISGVYTLVVKGVKDQYKNEMTEQSITFEVEDKTAPEFPDTASLHGSEVQTLIIDFDDVMATEGVYSVLDLEKYKVQMQKNHGDDDDPDWRNAGYVELADIDDGLSISISDDGKKVEIELDTEDAGYRFVVGYFLQIARVADAAGNKTAALSSGPIAITSVGVVEADEFEAVAKDELRLTLKAALSDFAEEDFVLYLDGTRVTNQLGDIAVEEERNDDGNSVIIFRLLDKELSADGKFETKAITISSATEPESGDRYGAKINFANEPLKDKIKPALVDIDDYDAITSNENVITLEFDEPLKYATGGSSTTAAYDFVIEADEVLDANYDYTVEIGIGANKNKVYITLINDYKTYDGTVIISTASKVKTIVDESNGNALADIEDEDAEVATTPTVEIVQTVVGTVYKNVVCTFNEEMDVATLVGPNFIFDEELLATFTVNDDGDVLTIGLSAEPENETELIITDGVTDYSGTKFAPSKFVYDSASKKWTFKCYMKWDKESESWEEVAGV